MHAARRNAYEQDMPIYGIDKSWLTSAQEASHTGQTLFENENPTWLEIGFGNGEHLASLGRRFPDTNLIGCEPFINGVSALLKDIREEPIAANLKVWPDNALILMDKLADNSLERVYLLNPDPWPKTRHHKRRFLSQENLSRISRLLKPGGLLISATDVSELAEWMLSQALNHGAFNWQAHNKQDWLSPPEEWIETRYAAKGRAAGREEIFLIFKNQK